jgi:diguanylate cyclase (GGDEF)-like protein
VSPRKNLRKWLWLSLLAATFFLAASGICVRHVTDIPTAWMIGAWIGAFLWLFVLDQTKAFSKSHRYLLVLGTTIGFNLLAQTTGGDQSPIIFAVFLLIGVAAWTGEAKFGFWVAILFSFLEAASLRNDADSHGWALYLRWAAFIVSAFFLARLVKTRTEKEQLDHKLDSLKYEAERLITAEPSSFNIPKDKLLREESRLTARVGTVMGLEDSLHRQAVLFQKTIQLNTTAIFLLTPIEEKTVFRLRAASTESDSLAPDVTVLPGETLIGLAAKEGRRVLLNQIAEESAKALPYYLKPNSVASFLAQPLYGNKGTTAGEEEKKLLGVIVFDSLKDNFFGVRELELIGKFCAVVEEAIEHAKTLHFSKTKSRNLNALYEVSNAFSALLDFKKVLQLSLKTAADIFPCDSAYIAMAEGDGKVFTIRAWWGPSRSNQQPIQLEGELAGWVLENKKPIRYTRGQKDRSLLSFSKKEGMLGSIQSFLLVPLMVGENILGVIRLNSSHQDIYQEYDQDVLSTLANQTALAIENALMVERIQNMAVKDGLTGVYNHRYFQESLEEEISKAERYNKDLSFLLLDVDHFKKFNDNYGHQEGDKVLRKVAEIAQNTIRQKVDTLARYGGEEFAIILPETDGNSAKDLAERVRQNIESYLFENEGKGVYRVTVSVGVSSYPFDAREQSKLIQAADIGLYESKARGRNRVTLFRELKGEETKVEPSKNM